MENINKFLIGTTLNKSKLPESPEEPSVIKHKFPRLYARSKTGKIRIYDIYILQYTKKRYCELITEKRLGFEGAVQSDKYTYTRGVNIGKANETTYIEQAMNNGKSLFRKLLDQGFSKDIPTDDFNTDANGYMKPMLAIGYSEKKIKFPCYCQPKYDGVRSLSFIGDDGKVVIMSRQGKRYKLPHLEKWLDEHRDILPLDGELYNHNELTFQEICSAVKKQSDITTKIRAVVYDKPIGSITFTERKEILENAFSGISSDSPFYLSKGKYCNSLKEIREYHDECVGEGYEGCIIRNLGGLYEFGFRSNDLIKLKVFDTDEFPIVDVVEASGRDTGTAIFVLETPLGAEFRAKPQGSRELRAEYLENADYLIGKMCTLKYQGLSDDGIPRFPSAINVRDYE